MRARWLVCVAVACQGNADQPTAVAKSGAPDEPTVPQPQGSQQQAPAPRGSAEAPAPDEPAPAPKPDDADPPPDPGKTIAELGAVPAWQAVVDRARYLARRGQHGVAYGVLDGEAPIAAGSDAGPPPGSPYVWLVDDSEGNGALAIRVKLGPRVQAKAGDRVALRGAWLVDDGHRWYWSADAATPLPASTAPPPKDPPATPGHAIKNGELPAGARTISVAKDNDAVYFTVVGAPPAVDGDGWPVADELGNPVYALLNLPGERASYGGLDLRSPDERWQLRRGQTYWVRIGRVRKHGPDKPATINARTAPVRVK